MNETLFVGKVLKEFQELASTNDYASDFLHKNSLEEGTVILSHFQSKGKGADGKSWESERGKNLLISVVLKPHFLAPKRQFLLNQAICLSLAETVADCLNRKDVKIKWPNDIYCDNKKVAGILIENSLRGEFIQHSIVGIGLNVNQAAFVSPTHATSLKLLAGKDFELKGVLNILCQKIEYRYLQSKSNQIEKLQKDYMNGLYRAKEETWYKALGKKFKAKINGITPEGKLILLYDGECSVFGFKEVEMIL